MCAEAFVSAYVCSWRTVCGCSVYTLHTANVCVETTQNLNQSKQAKQCEITGQTHRYSKEYFLISVVEFFLIALIQQLSEKIWKNSSNCRAMFSLCRA